MAQSKQIWVDGREVASWKYSGPVRPGRCRAADRGGRASEGLPTAFLDADLAMPAIYGKALSPAEIAARFADRGSVAAGRARAAGLLAARRRTGRARGRREPARAARAASSTTATWMIGGPGFDADVPRFGTYDPAKDPRRGHGLRLASDDLFDCRWKATHEYRLPENARSGIYAGRIRFQLDGEERLYHTVFIVEKAAVAAQGADRVPLLDQYLEGLCGHAVQSDLERDQEVDRQQRLRQQPGRPAGVLLLSTASRRPGDVSDRASGCPGRSSARTRSWARRNGITAISAGRIGSRRSGWKRRATTTTS